MAAFAGTGTADIAEAQKRLGQAIDEFDPASHARARTLCMTRLARLHLAADNLDEAVHWARETLTSAAGLYSSRLYRDLATIRAVADDKGEPRLRELVADIDALTGTEE